MTPEHRRILARHKNSLKGALRILPFRSRALGVSRNVFVYEPPTLRVSRRMHLLYLFRGHEREHVNVDEDASRKQTTIEMLDGLISEGSIPPVLAIMPGLTSYDNAIHSLGINMMGGIPHPKTGMGTGMFWTFLSDELIPYIESRYANKLMDGLRLASGFSLGGYTVALLATALPGYLNHAGMYDALFMFDSQTDFRTNRLDSVWMGSGVFNAALGLPSERTPYSLSPWNPTELIKHGDFLTLDQVRQTTFWVRTAAKDREDGNLDRGRYFVEILKASEVPLGFSLVPFRPDSHHDWHWNDRFLKLFLRNVFEG